MPEKLERNDFTALDEKQKDYLIYTLVYELAKSLNRAADALESQNKG